MLSREKGSEPAPLGLAGRFLWSGFGLKIAEFRPFLAFCGAILRNFSLVQTAWRRERDSNPRYGFVRLSPSVFVSCRSQSYSREICEMGLGVSRPLRFPFAFPSRKKANDWRFHDRNLVLGGSPGRAMGSRVTAYLAGSPRTQNSPQNILRRGWSISRTFSKLVHALRENFRPVQYGGGTRPCDPRYYEALAAPTLGNSRRAEFFE